MFFVLILLSPTTFGNLICPTGNLIYHAGNLIYPTGNLIYHTGNLIYIEETDNRPELVAKVETNMFKYYQELSNS